MVFEHDYKDFPELTNRQIDEFGFSSPHKQIVEDFDAEVVKVIDGDTYLLKTSFRDFSFPLRLLDIDALEMNEGGAEAREWVEDRLLNEEVRVIIDVKQRVGKYGRLLGKVFHRGMDLGFELIVLGLAAPFGQRDEGSIPRMDKLFRVGQWL